jgi:hypothetical protein
MPRMRNIKLKKIMLPAGACVFVAMLPQAQADQHDQRSFLAFSGPVKIPGKILGAGTYDLNHVSTAGNWYMVDVNNDKNLFSSRDPLFEGRILALKTLRFM